MKFLKIFLFLLLPVLGYAQPGTWPIRYSDEDPTTAPSGAGTRVYFNTATNTLFFWEPSPSSQWRKQPKSFDQITGCSAPAYTPTARQSTFVVNSCTIPELYQWTGAEWVKLNSGASYTAGTGINISGSVISNTGDLSATNELNTALYVDAGSLVLDDGGGSVSIPLSQFRQGIYNAGTGISINSGTGAISNTGDLSTTNELNTAFSVTGGNLRLTDPGGNLDVSVSSIAPVQAVAAGAGINISGSTTRTISAVDVSATNEIQTLSISGQDLSLSSGGGTVTIPAGADGNGIYSGSGTIPGATEATLTANDYFSIKFSNGNDAFSFYDDEGSFYANSKNGVHSITASNESLVFGNVGSTPFNIAFSDDDKTALFVDGRTSKIGFGYAAEYPDILTNDRSIPDVGLTKQLIASEGWEWPLLAPDGTSEAPSYSFENAPGSGLYKASKGIALFAGSGNSISIRTQSETADPSQGITINTGSSEDGETGSFLIFAGESTNGVGGGFSLQGGAGGIQGGNFTMTAGNSNYGVGGDFSMISGSSGSGNGGRVLMSAGNSGDATGGDIVMTPGSGVTGNGKIICAGGDGLVFTPLLSAQISSIISPTAGQSVFCTDCTATDSSTGVLKIYNGIKWKNAW